MIAATNLTVVGTQTKNFQELACSPLLVGELQKQSFCFAVVNILLSITAFFGNFLILVALHKESSLHPPSKFLYRCLATTDLLVGLLSQPLSAIYYMTLVCEDWSLCRYAWDTGYGLYIMWSVFVDDYGHKRGQTSRLVIGAKIQTNCNFKAHICHCSYFLGYTWCCCFLLFSGSPDFILV